MRSPKGNRKDRFRVAYAGLEARCHRIFCCPSVISLILTVTVDVFRSSFCEFYIVNFVFIKLKNY